MARIEFTQQLQNLLKDSDLQAPIRALTDRVGEILADNKLPFFPDYTDHGIEHIECVLKSETELVPKQVWEQSSSNAFPRLLCEADAVVIVGATLLHDIGMHLRPEGFLELTAKDSRFRPLPWFKDHQEGHVADRPWDELWEEYVRDARRLSDRKLLRIVGPGSVRQGWKFQSLPSQPGQWELNHCLVIGEFIRRHHARLAHEIAIYGFPGLPIGDGEGQFPAAGSGSNHPLQRLADLIGLTARSHGISLRLCKAYLDAEPRYAKNPRPMGCAAIYPMALLRVADYLQLDRKRAPAVLLQLRAPQSPTSVQEWQKHFAVDNIGPADDPLAKTVTVNADIPLKLYLQLRDLLAGLQSEMDHSTAVLDEIYGTRSDLGLNQLNLATRRVYSNLDSSPFRDRLPYVPERTGFSADPNLLTLLVEPLYGKQPSVGVRELMQNAVDAVCELDAWCKTHGRLPESLNLPEQAADVLIEFIKREDGSWLLRVTDKGIGMTDDTLQHYFLRAGACFRQSAEWTKEFVDEDGHARALRAGRFGIGAFATFLLGPSFRLSTRHVTASNPIGYSLEASADSELIEIRRVENLPVGTTVEVEIDDEWGKQLPLELATDWFCWDWPTVVRRVAQEQTPRVLEQKYTASLRRGVPGPEWAVLRPTGFDAVYWTFSHAPGLSCNGIAIRHPDYDLTQKFSWPDATQLDAPSVAVLDSAANLPLTTQRYRLSAGTVPFLDELVRDVTLSFIAHSLVCGPSSADEALSGRRRHPLSPQRAWDIADGGDGLPVGSLRWCVTGTKLVPLDPWLYTLLEAETCVSLGFIDIDQGSEERWSPLGLADLLPKAPICAMVSWLTYFDEYESRKSGNGESFEEAVDGFLARFTERGIAAISDQPAAGDTLVSAFSYLDWDDLLRRNDKIREEHPQADWNRSKSLDETKRRYLRWGRMVISITAHGKLLGALEGSFPQGRNRRGRSCPSVLFVSECQTSRTTRSPETPMAQVWNECLGANAIPFDRIEREALIERGRLHAELRRHIDAWKAMSRT